MHLRGSACPTLVAAVDDQLRATALRPEPFERIPIPGHVALAAQSQWRFPRTVGRLVR